MSDLVGNIEVWRDLESRTFYCPACGSERIYRHRRARRWVRVIVPILPKEITNDVYECQTCHHVYDEHVITSPPTSDLATRLQRLTRAAVVLAMLDGDPYDVPTRRRALTVIQGAGLSHYSETDLDADLRSIDVTLLDEEAQQLTIDLDLPSRERLVADVGHVATATGSFSRTNRSMLDQLGRSLAIPPGAVHRILSQLGHEASNIGAFTSHDPPPGSDG